MPPSQEGEAGGARRISRGGREEESRGERTVYITDETGKFKKEKAAHRVRIRSQLKGDAARKCPCRRHAWSGGHEATLEALRWTREVKLPPPSPDPWTSRKPVLPFTGPVDMYLNYIT